MDFQTSNLIMPWEETSISQSARRLRVLFSILIKWEISEALEL